MVTYTWPYFYYLMWHYDEVGGWMRLRYCYEVVNIKYTGTKLCKCKINDLRKYETGAWILFNSPWPQLLCSSDPLTLLTHIVEPRMSVKFFHNLFAYNYGGEESRPWDLEAWIVEGRIFKKCNCNSEEIQHYDNFIPPFATYKKFEAQTKN